MTNEELINYLKQFSPKYQIVYKCYSDWTPLHIEDICLYNSEDKLMAFRNGRYMDVRENQFPKNEKPVWVDAIAFPGN